MRTFKKNEKFKTNIHSCGSLISPFVNSIKKDTYTSDSSVKSEQNASFFFVIVVRRRWYVQRHQCVR